MRSVPGRGVRGDRGGRGRVRVADETVRADVRVARRRRAAGGRGWRCGVFGRAARTAAVPWRAPGNGAGGQTVQQDRRGPLQRRGGRVADETRGQAADGRAAEAPGRGGRTGGRRQAPDGQPARVQVVQEPQARRRQRVAVRA